MRKLFVFLMVLVGVLILWIASMTPVHAEEVNGMSVEYNLYGQSVDQATFVAHVKAHSTTRNRTVAKSAAVELPMPPSGNFFQLYPLYDGTYRVAVAGEAPFTPLGGVVEIHDNGQLIGKISPTTLEGDIAHSSNMNITSRFEGQVMLRSVGEHYLEQRWYATEGAYYSIKGRAIVLPTANLAGVCRASLADGSVVVKVVFQIFHYDLDLSALEVEANRARGWRYQIMPSFVEGVSQIEIPFTPEQYDPLVKEEGVSFIFHFGKYSAGVGVHLPSSLGECGGKG